MAVADIGLEQGAYVELIIGRGSYTINLGRLEQSA